MKCSDRKCNRHFDRVPVAHTLSGASRMLQNGYFFQIYCIYATKYSRCVAYAIKPHCMTGLLYAAELSAKDTPGRYIG